MDNIFFKHSKPELLKPFSNIQNSPPFIQPPSVVEREIDLISLEDKHKLELATPHTPARFKSLALFSVFNLPKEISQNFVDVEQSSFDVSYNSGFAEVKFLPKRHLIYNFYDGKKLIASVADQNKPQTLQLKISGENLLVRVGFDEKNQKTYNYKLKKEAETQPQSKHWFI